jgi:adenine-specific DNA-methyltransferase
VGDVVLDPFCGGGTTPYVCEQLGRHWVGFEIDPDAAAVAKSRLLDVQMPLVLHTEEQHSMNLGATA